MTDWLWSLPLWFLIALPAAFLGIGVVAVFSNRTNCGSGYDRRFGSDSLSPGRPQSTYAQSRPDSNPADSLTLAALGVIAYTFANVLHEGVGHGGACLLSGSTPLVMSTVHMECSTETRLVAAGGTVVNFAAVVFSSS